MFIHIYERSTCRYIRLNGLNVLHAPQPHFIAPKTYGKISLHMNSFLLGFVKSMKHTFAHTFSLSLSKLSEEVFFRSFQSPNMFLEWQPCHSPVMVFCSSRGFNHGLSLCSTLRQASFPIPYFKLF